MNEVIEWCHRHAKAGKQSGGDEPQNADEHVHDAEDLGAGLHGCARKPQVRENAAAEEVNDVGHGGQRKTEKVRTQEPKDAEDE